MKNSVGRAITVTQASAFGRVLTDIDMSIDPTTGQVTNVAATNVLVSQPDADSMTSPVHAFLSSPQVVGIRRLIADYSNAVAPVANQPIGAIAAPLPSAPDASGSGEELAGDLVADSQLAVTAPADGGGGSTARRPPHRRLRRGRSPPRRRRRPRSPRRRPSAIRSKRCPPRRSRPHRRRSPSPTA